MEASITLPDGEPQIPEFKIWRVYEDGETLHHLSIDGNYAGLVDWEESREGTEGAIDGLDAEKELELRGIKELAWFSIAQCMKDLNPKIKRIWCPEGLISVDGRIEELQVD